MRAVIKIKTMSEPSSRGRQTKQRIQMIASQGLWSGEQNRMEIIWSMCMRHTAGARDGKGISDLPLDPTLLDYYTSRLPMELEPNFP